MTPPFSSRRASSSGFTLLEVLVASAVLALMMGILLSSVSTTLTLWRNTENSIASDREGRSGHLLLAMDLANAVVPTNTNSLATNLWPRVTDNGARLRFLTRKSPEYQDSSAGDVGDLCYVEYLVTNNTLQRRFVGSQETYEALRSNALPAAANLPTNTNSFTSSDFQLLADNVIGNTNALKGSPVMNTPADIAAIRTNFVLIRFVTNTNVIPPAVTYTNAGSSRPDAIEVNLGTAHAEALRNTNLLSLPNYQIRSAGFFTFRVNLPK